MFAKWLKFFTFIMMVTTIVESQLKYHIFPSKTSYGWSLSSCGHGLHNTSRSIKCGTEFLNQTIGLSFYDNKLYQFIIDDNNVIKVIVYFDQSKHIILDGQSIHIKLSDGSQYKLSEIDLSLANFLQEHDFHIAVNMALVVASHHSDHVNGTLLFAFIYRFIVNNYQYGYHYKSNGNLIVGDMRNCIYNQNCPIKFSRVILINTADRVLVFTSKLDDDPRNFVLQNFQLNETIGYICMMKRKKNFLELSQKPCQSNYHEIKENDRLMQFDYGFVITNRLYLISKMNQKIWQINSQILSEYGKQFSIEIRTTYNFFICIYDIAAESSTEMTTPTTIYANGGWTTKKNFHINNSSSATTEHHQTTITTTTMCPMDIGYEISMQSTEEEPEMTIKNNDNDNDDDKKESTTMKYFHEAINRKTNNSFLITGCIFIIIMALIGTALFLWTESDNNYKKMKNNLKSTKRLFHLTKSNRLVFNNTNNNRYYPTNHTTKSSF